MAAAATSNSVNGVMGDKALVSIDGAPPRVMRVGEALGGVRLVRIGPQGVEIVVDGRRHVLAIDPGVRAPRMPAGAAGGLSGRVALTADERGHFTATGAVNGLPVRFMVDTGASLVALPRSVARQAGVNLSQATPVVINTANGRAPAQRVVINSLRLGQIGANLVEAVVVDDSALSQSLLGMSFLNRTNMQREGDTLVLTQRY
ncbi:MAG: TIGR02281 family clan AA aspartic protease [Thiobacillaceae bacterium]